MTTWPITAFSLLVPFQLELVLGSRSGLFGALYFFFPICFNIFPLRLSIGLQHILFIFLLNLNTDWCCWSVECICNDLDVGRQKTIECNKKKKKSFYFGILYISYVRKRSNKAKWLLNHECALYTKRYEILSARLCIAVRLGISSFMSSSSPSSAAKYIFEFPEMNIDGWDKRGWLQKRNLSLS